MTPCSRPRRRAESVLAVPLAELIIGLVAFLIVFGLLAKLALPGIRKALDERTAAIEGGHRAAEASAGRGQRPSRSSTRPSSPRRAPRRRRSGPRRRRTSRAILEEATSEATEAAASRRRPGRRRSIDRGARQHRRVAAQRGRRRSRFTSRARWSGSPSTTTRAPVPRSTGSSPTSRPRRRRPRRRADARLQPRVARRGACGSVDASQRRGGRGQRLGRRAVRRRGPARRRDSRCAGPSPTPGTPTSGRRRRRDLAVRGRIAAADGSRPRADVAAAALVERRRHGRRRSSRSARRRPCTVPSAAARSTAVEDELFRFGRAVDASPELQLRSPTRRLPGAGQGRAGARPRRRSQADPVTRRCWPTRRGHLRGRGPAAARRAPRPARGGAAPPGARRRSARAVALDAEQQTRLSRGPDPRRTAARSELNIERRPRGRRWHRRQRRRRGHRRQRLDPAGAGAPRAVRLNEHDPTASTNDRARRSTTAPRQSPAVGNEESRDDDDGADDPAGGDPGRARADTSQSYAPETTREEVGRVTETGDGIARVEGLHSAMTNELLEFEGGMLGLALNLDVREIGVVLLGDGSAHRGGPAGPAHRRDPLGPGRRRLPRPGRRPARPPDRRPGRDRATEAAAPLELQAPTVVQRQPVKEPMQTGIKAIDAMTAIGRGQRQLIIGDRQTGKTAVALDTIINQRDNWESGDPEEAGQVHLRRDRPEGLDDRGRARARSRRPARWSTRPSSPRPRPTRPASSTSRPYTGSAIGQHWMYQGQHVADRLRRPVQAGRGLPRGVAAAAPPAGPRGLPR